MSVVFVVMAAKDKAFTLPLYLKCLRAQTFDPALIHLYFCYSDELIQEFVTAHGDEYASVFIDLSENAAQYAIDRDAHMFVSDCTTFLHSSTLKKIYDIREIGIVTPMLQSPTNVSTFCYELDKAYHRFMPPYYDVLSNRLTGVVQVLDVSMAYFVHNRLLSRSSSVSVSKYVDNRYYYGFMTIAKSAAEFSRELNAENWLIG